MTKDDDFAPNNGRIYVPTAGWSEELDMAKKASILKSEKQQAIMKLASSYATEQDPYPSPFLNLSDLQIPKSMVEIFKWCRYFYKFDPLIAGAINNLATFPITEVYFEDISIPGQPPMKEESESLKLYQNVIVRRLQVTRLLVEIGIDYWLYGNCFIFGELANYSGDPMVPDYQWKHVIRLDPSKMVIDIDPITQEKTYKWEVPNKIKRLVREKKPVDKYQKIPDVIKQAVKENKTVVLNPHNVYHFSRPGESGDGSVWGTPVILNVLKLLMYRNILRQAQEAIAREHIVPFRVYFLEPTEKYDPISQWNSVAKALANQLAEATKDPNYKVVSPVPVGVLNLGGQGRALMLTPELEQLQAEILAGMGVPREFIFGGVSYSGSSFSLRILENQFETYRLLVLDFLNEFLIKRMAKARQEWQTEDDDIYIPTAKLSDLKMQDDIQQKQLVINLNAANKVSDDYLYNMMGIDTDKMKQQLLEEMMERLEMERVMTLYQTETQGIAMQQQMQYQMDAQMQQQAMYAQAGMIPPEQQAAANEQAQQETESKERDKDRKLEEKKLKVEEKKVDVDKEKVKVDKEKSKSEGKAKKEASSIIEEIMEKLSAGPSPMNAIARDPSQVMTPMKAQLATQQTGPGKKQPSLSPATQQLLATQSTGASKPMSHPSSTGGPGGATDMRPAPLQRPPRRTVTVPGMPKMGSHLDDDDDE